MGNSNYVLKYVPRKRIKYQLLTLLPPLACFLLLIRLSITGMLPNGYSTVFMLIPFTLLWVLTYLFIFRKIHNIAVYTDRLVESGWRGKEYTVYFSSISNIRTNLLGEIILKDAQGKKLLCIEDNLENRERLLEQLQSLVQ